MRIFRLLPLLAMSTLLLTSCGGENHAQELETKIKNMGGASAELGSVEYTISKIIAVDHDVFYKIGERKVLFSSLSTMKAGVDLSLFCADSVDVDAKKVLLTLDYQRQKFLPLVCLQKISRWNILRQENYVLNSLLKKGMRF